MEQCVEDRFLKVLNKTAFFREDAKSDTNKDEKKTTEKIKKCKEEISVTKCIKKPKSKQQTRTTNITSASKEQYFNVYRYKQEQNNTEVNIVCEDSRSVISDCSDNNSGDEFNHGDKGINVSELCNIKEFRGLCNWLENCVTEENCIVPEDLIIYNELKKEDKVLEWVETWRKYFDQPVDVLKFLEEADHVNADAEIQELNQCIEDLEYISKQLRYELRNIGLAAADMRSEQNKAEFQLAECVRQCLIHCKQYNIRLGQLLCEIDSFKKTLQLLTLSLDRITVDSTSGESTIDILSTSGKSDLEKSQYCKQEMMLQENYIFQTSLRKYEAAFSLFQSSLDAVLPTSVEEDHSTCADEVLCGTKYQDLVGCKFWVTPDSDLHEFCRLRLSLPKFMIERIRLASKKTGLQEVIEELHSLKKDIETGNFDFSSLKIRTKLAKTQETSNLKSECEAIANELCKACTEWVEHYIKQGLLAIAYSKLFTIGLNDLTVEKLLDVMLRIKTTGDILILLSLFDCNSIKAAVKLIIDTEDSLSKYISSVNEYEVVIESNCAKYEAYLSHHIYEHSELLKRVADMLGSDVREIENALETVNSPVNDQLKTVLLLFTQKYSDLRFMEHQLSKWYISVCDRPVWKPLKFDVANWVDVSENQIVKAQYRLDKLVERFHENQEKITLNEGNRIKRLLWIVFLVDVERKKI